MLDIFFLLNWFSLIVGTVITTMALKHAIKAYTAKKARSLMPPPPPPSSSNAGAVNTTLSSSSSRQQTSSSQHQEHLERQFREALDRIKTLEDRVATLSAPPTTTSKNTDVDVDKYSNSDNNLPSSLSRGGDEQEGHVNATMGVVVEMNGMDRMTIVTTPAREETDSVVVVGNAESARAGVVDGAVSKDGIIGAKEEGDSTTANNSSTSVPTPTIPPLGDDLPTSLSPTTTTPHPILLSSLIGTGSQLLVVIFVASISSILLFDGRYYFHPTVPEVGWLLSSTQVLMVLYSLSSLIGGFASNWTIRILSISSSAPSRGGDDNVTSMPGDDDNCNFVHGERRNHQHHTHPTLPLSTTATRRQRILSCALTSVLYPSVVIVVGIILCSLCVDDDKGSYDGGIDEPGHSTSTFSIFFNAAYPSLLDVLKAWLIVSVPLSTLGASLSEMWFYCSCKLPTTSSQGWSLMSLNPEEIQRSAQETTQMSQIFIPGAFIFLTICLKVTLQTMIFSGGSGSSDALFTLAHVALYFITTACAPLIQLTGGGGGCLRVRWQWVSFLMGAASFIYIPFSCNLFYLVNLLLEVPWLYPALYTVMMCVSGGLAGGAVSFWAQYWSLWSINPQPTPLPLH